MSLLEHEAQTLQAFKSSVEDLALAELARLEAEQEQLAAALASVVENIKRVRAVLRASQNGSGPGAKPKPRKKQSTFKLSDEREEQILPWLEGNEEEITSRSIKAQFPTWSDSYCNMALNYLRESGTIRLSGTAGQMNVYRSMV